MLERVLVGKRIERVGVVDDRIVFADTAPRTFARKLKGRRVTAASRRGKQMWLELDERPWPLLHFGMTGGFVEYESTKDRPRFWKVEFVTEDGRRLAMTNARRLGRIRLQDDPLNEVPICKLGFDPLLDMPSPGRFVGLVQARKAPLKAILLDQGFAAGVGNWIADEVLYQAKLSPHRTGSDLTDAEAKRMRTKLGLVIRKAVEVDANKKRFPHTWLFHHRWGRPEDAKTAKGELIEHETIAGRTTAWAPSVQK